MNSSVQRNLARAAGALVGVGLLVVLLVASRPGAAASKSPASVRVAVVPAGEFEVTPPPPEPFLTAPSLRPGSAPIAGGFRIRNQTGKDLAVTLKAEANSTALNGLLRVRARIGDRLVADTTLEGLRRRPLRLRLLSGRAARVRLEAWLPTDVLSGYQGALVGVSLLPRARALGGRR